MDEPFIEGNGYSITGRVPFSLVLLKAQEFVGVVNIRVAKVFEKEYQPVMILHL